MLGGAAVESSTDLRTPDLISADLAPLEQSEQERRDQSGEKWNQ
jgi:hypothetical protein